MLDPPLPPLTTTLTPTPLPRTTGTATATAMAALAAVAAVSGIPATAAAELRREVAAELLVGGGADSNIFLQVAATPDSAAWHATGVTWFARTTPALALSLSGDGVRMSLQYQADLRLGAGAGLLAVQELLGTVAATELGRASAHISARVGRYDSTQHSSDRFFSVGAEAGAALRLSRALRLSGRYRLDRRQFSDPDGVGTDHDWVHGVEGRIEHLGAEGLIFGLEADYVALRSIRANPALDPGRLERLLLQGDVAWPATSVLVLRAAVWGGLQRHPDLASDRQAGGAATVTYLLSETVSALIRYDVMVNRATDANSFDYDRQVGLIAFVVRTPASAPPAPATDPVQPGGEEGSEAPVVNGSRVLFRMRAPGATSVRVIGSWNDWMDGLDQNLRQTHDADLWEASVTTGPGLHRYRFLVDDRAVRPHDAPSYRADGFGGEDGVVNVR